MKKYPKGIFEFFSSETPRLQLNRSHVHISKFKYSHGTFFEFNLRLDDGELHLELDFSIELPFYLQKYRQI